MIQQVPSDSDSQREEIDRILEGTGYAYDWEQRIYYSVNNPWQRKMGYCSLYDELSSPLGMVFDCEPVRFHYRGKKWLIEFWKGQYGITVGGEIGVYNTSEPDLDIPGIFKGTFYRCADDDETLDMAFTLRRNGRMLFERADRHWWLTGFVLGEYASPSSLTMEASVTLLDEEMRYAFLNSLRGLGYRSSEIGSEGNTVWFDFSKPRSRQPLIRLSPVSLLAMYHNKVMVAQFRQITAGLPGLYEQLMALKEKSPLLYGLAMNIGRQRDLFQSFDGIREYLA